MTYVNDDLIIFEDLQIETKIQKMQNILFNCDL